MPGPQFKATLEMLIPLIIKEIIKSWNVSEQEKIAMSNNVEFIAYCLEEYKAANDMTGKEAITLFKKYNIIDYIVSCYGALHTMGGLAIAEDINSLIEDIKSKQGYY